MSQVADIQSLADPAPEHDEGDFFIAPKAVADSQFTNTDSQRREAPKPNPKPEAKGVAPPAPSAIPEALFDLAETLGLSREEAKTLGTPEALSRTLSIIRKQQEAQARQSQQQQVQNGQQQRTHEDEPFDDTKLFGSDDWHPEIKQMAAVVKRLERQNRELLQQVQQLSGLEGQRQNEQGKSLFHGTLKDLGLTHIISSEAKEKQLLSRTNGLAQMYRSLNEPVPPPKDLVAQAAKLLGFSPQRQAAVQSAAPRPANGDGAPSHRRFKMEQPSRLAAKLTDIGVDPGPEHQEADYGFFYQ